MPPPPAMTKPSRVASIGPARALRRVVVLRAHRAHRVEQAGQRPVQLLAAAGEDDVLLAELDLLDAAADAVRAVEQAEVIE